MRNKTSIIIGILIIVVVVTFFFFPEEGDIDPTYSRPVFTFSIEETGEPIDGEVIFIYEEKDEREYYLFFEEPTITYYNESQGMTKDGKMPIQRLNNYPLYLVFKGDYQGSSFEVYYYFPTDFEEYTELPFILTKGEDEFPGIEQSHWGHMPLTYQKILM